MISLILPGEYVSFNEYSDAERKNRHVGAKIKKEETQRAWVDTLNQKNRNALRIEKYPVQVHFTWYCKNRKKDPDNICSARKFILDGFQDAGLMENDGWKQIAGFSDSFHIDKENPRVEVTITW